MTTGSDWLYGEGEFRQHLAAIRLNDHRVLVTETNLLVRAGILDGADNQFVGLIDMIGIGGERVVIDADTPLIAQHADAVLEAGVLFSLL